MLILISIQPVYVLYVIILLLVIAYILAAFLLGRSMFYNVIMKKDKPGRIKKIGQSNGVNKVKDRLRRFKIQSDGDFFEKAIKIKNYSLDGLALNGYLYEQESNIYVICLPGYSAKAKTAYGLQQYVLKKLGYNILSLDHRSVGDSKGDYASFGYYEHLDLLRWINKLIEMKGNDIKIIINGTSMGGNTSLLVANRIPKQVIGIIADSAYVNAAEQFECMTMKRTHLPILFTKLSVKFLNQFTKKKLNVDLYKYSSEEVLKKTRCPVCFITSESDSVVSPKFSKRNYDACNSELKKLYIIPNSDHLLTCYVNEERYSSIVKSFIEECEKLS